jgi:hypothetical protein
MRLQYFTTTKHIPKRNRTSSIEKWGFTVFNEASETHPQRGLTFVEKRGFGVSQLRNTFLKGRGPDFHRKMKLSCFTNIKHPTKTFPLQAQDPSRAQEKSRSVIKNSHKGDSAHKHNNITHEGEDAQFTRRGTARNEVTQARIIKQHFIFTIIPIAKNCSNITCHSLTSIPVKGE